VLDDVPNTTDRKGYVQALTGVLAIDRQARFQLDFERMVTVLVIGEEIGALPIVCELDAVEAMVGEQRRDLLVVVDLLLPRAEFAVDNLRWKAI
jgi:hypothetical protein